MNYSGRRSACMLAAATLFLSPHIASAYELWSQAVNDVGNCATCHGAFREGTYQSPGEGLSWGDHLHDVHLDHTDVESAPNGSCDSCHGGTGTTGRMVNLDSSSDAKDGVNAIACMGCHGRLEDANNLGFLGEPGWGAGLRQHHENSANILAGPGTCSGCHADANPASFTTAPEDTSPPWYASVTNTSIAMLMDPCSPDGEEDFSSNGTGLDNDGDGLTDPADADCAPPVEDADLDGVPDSIDLCADTAMADPVDPAGCSDAQVDGDDDGFCNPGAPSSGPSACTGSDAFPDDPDEWNDNDNDGVGDNADPDDDNDGIADNLDNDPLLANNFCIGAEAYIFSETVVGPLTCAATSSITVVSLAEVLVTGNLQLIAPFVSFESGFSVAGALTVISADPCPGC